MSRLSTWADDYVKKTCTAADAIERIRPGQRVFIGSSCGEPQHLVRALTNAPANLTDLEVVRLMSLETTPLTLIAGQRKGSGLNIRQFYSGSAKPKAIARNARFITPMNLSAVPRLFRSRRLPIHVALIQTTPPDDFGCMSLGVSVDITLAAALSADLVIAQVNPRMPRVLGRSILHVNDVDLFVHHEEPLITLGTTPDSSEADTIARLIARLIDDGSTIQIGPGTTPMATLAAMKDKNELGVHTQYLTDPIMHLFSRGVITNRRKGFNEGKIVAGSAVGSENLYEFINDNPVIEFHPSDYVNDPSIIARHHKMVSINVAMAIDLTGQVAADALPYNHFSGVTGMLDFIRGSAMSEGGKSLLLLPATAMQGNKSRIVPMLDDMAVVVPRSDIHYVCTEYGVVNLFGKSMQERALAMISIAHPDFRDELFSQAKAMDLLGAQ
ncbi:MAG TPA: acetyl-CoA hydrolase/transferase C-terminal domain-containing protein, partial [Desulfosarcina sp.]|nr:acetyl-CoA hydrolase/transferase C-terminal domain-containing protein [Desulfosarcina sp.]